MTVTENALLSFLLPGQHDVHIWVQAFLLFTSHIFKEPLALP